MNYLEKSPDEFSWKKRYRHKAKWNSQLKRNLHVNTIFIIYFLLEVLCRLCIQLYPAYIITELHLSHVELPQKKPVKYLVRQSWLGWWFQQTC
jgi:hypothetical protein